MLLCVPEIIPWYDSKLAQRLGLWFSFYYVQIAPFSYGKPLQGALLEAQRLTLSLPNTGMAVTTDIGNNVQDIHPKTNRDVGQAIGLLGIG